MRKVYVLLVITGGLMDDGVTSWALQIFEAMDRIGFDLHVIAWPETDARIIHSFRNLGFTVEVLPSRRDDFAAYAKELGKLIKARSFDIVHACGSSAIMALELAEARRAGVAMRVAHSHNTTCAHKMADKILRPFLYACATDLWACGNAAGKWLFGNRRFTVVPNGKDTSEYAYSAKERRKRRAELGLPDDCLAIGHVGRFNKQKNQASFVGLATELSRRTVKYTFVFIGDGELREQVQEEFDAAGLSESARFLGTRGDVPSLLNAMDCMVLPSLHEGFPNVVLEWQVNGLPCIVSDSVTSECAVTPLVRFASLSDPASAWADLVVSAYSDSNREFDSERAAHAVVEAGYDITKNAMMLRDLYLDGSSR